jgi:hypothetical protein
MAKSNKVIVFIILLLVFIVVGIILNEISPGLGGLVSGAALLYVVFIVFNKRGKGDDKSTKDITLKK